MAVWMIEAYVQSCVRPIKEREEGVLEVKMM